MGRRGRPMTPRISAPAVRQIAGNISPIAGKTDQFTHPFQRSFHGEHVIAIHHKGAKFVPGPDPRIGLHKIQQTGRKCHLFDPLYALRNTALKKVAPKAVASHQLCRSLAHRLQALELECQMSGQFGARWALFGWIGWQ